MTDARLCAYRVLRDVTGNGAFSPRALDNEIHRMKLSEQDASLAANIVYGTLEKEKLLDRYIDARLKKAGKLSNEMRVLLRLSVYQLLFCDKIPKYSAINEGVEIAKRIDKKLGGFVNAVLREIDRRRDENMLPDKEKEPVEYLSLRYSVESWMVDMWIRELGIEETEAFLSACESRPPLTLRVNTLRISAQELKKRLGDEGVAVEIHPHVKNMLCVSNTGSIDRLKAYNDGLFHVQDAASAICCAVLDAKRGETVYDVCSAPGGKSFTTAEMMENEGILRSFDVSRKKLKLVREGADRLGISILSEEERDAAKGDPLPVADRVLCDVPCSGLGVIRKKPEIRKKKAADLSELPDIQLKILTESSKLVKDGGVLVYSTCTLVKAENEDVVSKFLKKNKNFKPLPFATPFSEKCEHMTFRPDLHGTDGFFVARMVKI